MCLWAGVAWVGLGSGVTASGSTIINLELNVGDVQIQLFDEIAPITTANFLSYATSDRYDQTFFHRLAPGFVLQGGGFSFDPPDFNFPGIELDDSIPNEFQRSNTRGTLSFARLGGDPDSATSQFFFNLSDNSANLDFQNGGFTVFAQVINDGLDLIDAIGTLPTGNFNRPTNGALGAVPIIPQDGGGSVFILLNDVQVLASALTGDLDNDGQLGAGDVTAFIEAITEGSPLGDAFELAAGDVNLDGVFNLADAELFAQRLEAVNVNTSALATLVPEPTTAVLLGVAGLLVTRRQRLAGVGR